MSPLDFALLLAQDPIAPAADAGSGVLLFLIQLLAFTGVFVFVFVGYLIFSSGWESYEERTKKNAAWRADPERAKKWAETEKDGPLVNRVYNQLMEPTAYSQLDRGEPYIFELREYQAMPQKIANVADRFGGFTCQAFKKHGFRQVGYWLNRLGGNDHQLIYLLAWESLDERVARFDTFAKDPERARVFAESEKNGPIVQQVTTTILRPTAFSPMK